MKKVLGHVVIIEKNTANAIVDELFQSIKDSDANPWCAGVKDEHYITKMKNEMNEISFIYLWDEDGKVEVKDEDILNQLINQLAEGGYGIKQINDIEYDIMFSHWEEL